MTELSKAVAEGLIEELSDMIDDRKGEDRRKRHDPNNEFSHPDKDRRSGKDRRHSS